MNKDISYQNMCNDLINILETWNSLKRDDGLLFFDIDGQRIPPKKHFLYRYSLLRALYNFTIGTSIDTTLDILNRDYKFISNLIDGEPIKTDEWI